MVAQRRLHRTGSRGQSGGSLPPLSSVADASAARSGRRSSPSSSRAIPKRSRVSGPIFTTSSRARKRWCISTAHDERAVPTLPAAKTWHTAHERHAFPCCSSSSARGRVVMLNCLKLPSPLHLFVILPVVAAGALYDSADSVLAITGGTGRICGGPRRDGAQRARHQRRRLQFRLLDQVTKPHGAVAFLNRYRTFRQESGASDSKLTEEPAR